MKTPAQWAQRAGVLAEEGRGAEALACLGRAMRARRRESSWFSLRSALHCRNGRFSQALSDALRAARLAPRDPGPRLARAELFALLGRFSEALADAARAVALAPGDLHAREARLRLLARAGRLTQARRALLRELPPGARRDLLLGDLELRAGRREAAARAFWRVLRSCAPDDNAALQARFYWLVARALARPERSRGAELRLCGLGMFPPYTASVATLRALAGCDVLVNNLGETESKQLIEAFGQGIRCVTYRDGGNDEHVLKTMTRELSQGRTVGFVTRGHAMVYGTLGSMAARRCRERGVAVRAYESLSSLDVLVVQLGLACDGLRMLDVSLIDPRKMDVRRTNIVTFNSESLEPPGVRRVEKSLARVYGADHAAWMYGPRYDTPPRAVRVGALSREFATINPSLMLVVPPKTRGS